PKGLAAYALALPSGEIQTSCLTEACRHLAERDFPAVVELLQPVPDAALRQSLLEQSARNCDLAHLDETAKYIAAMPASDDQKAAIKGLAARWAALAPETVVNWLCAFPATNSQPELVQSVIQSWSRSEPAAVAKWLTTQAPDTVSEDVASNFLAGAVAKYPDFAAQWTQSVTNETLRQKFQVQVARQWLKNDTSAATNWIGTLNLPEEVKQSLGVSK
ncbi:MAG TPA: hypothetical protein VF988_17595, partial [Verrucomicrobiae bacterium]